MEKFARLKELLRKEKILQDLECVNRGVKCFLALQLHKYEHYELVQTQVIPWEIVILLY